MINNAIDFDEFKEFMETIGQSITKEDFNVKVLSEYCSTTQGLTLKGFKAYFKDQIKEKGQSEVQEWLKTLGYDIDLYSTSSRSFIMTIHSEDQITLEVGDTVSTNLEQCCQQMIFRDEGNVLENSPEAQVLYTSKE